MRRNTSTKQYTTSKARTDTIDYGFERKTKNTTTEEAENKQTTTHKMNRANKIKQANYGARYARTPATTRKIRENGTKMKKVEQVANQTHRRTSMETTPNEKRKNAPCCQDKQHKRQQDTAEQAQAKGLAETLHKTNKNSR